MIYRTCTGCKFSNSLCEARETLKEKIKGLGITSIRWRCSSKVPLYAIGDPVWVLTAAGDGDEYLDDHGEIIRDWFPAVVISIKVAPKVLVFIETNAEGRSDYGDGITFQPTHARGFCKIPYSRIEPREGTPIKICNSCDMPEHLGHQDGFSCSIRVDPITQAPL